MNLLDRIEALEENIIKTLDYQKCINSVSANISAITTLQTPHTYCQKYADNQWLFHHCFIRSTKCDMDAILALIEKK